MPFGQHRWTQMEAISLRWIYKKELISDKIICRVIGVISFLILITLGAHIRINLPFTPVPITGQTLFVILSAAILGKRLGLITQVLYILLGGLGLPIFTFASFGLVYLLGPTGGYIIGFIFSCWCVAFLLDMKNEPNFGWLLLSFGVGSFIILCFGVIWLMALTRSNLLYTIYIGFLPFIIGDSVKTALAALIYKKIGNRARQIFKIS